MTLKNKLKVVFYYEKDHLQGYLIYENTANTLIVYEMYYLSSNVHYHLLNFVYAHSSMFEYFVFEDHHDHYHRYYAPESELMTVTVIPYMMRRIVNFEKFISKYRFTTDVDFKVKV